MRSLQVGCHLVENGYQNQNLELFTSAVGLTKLIARFTKCDNPGGIDSDCNNMRTKIQCHALFFNKINVLLALCEISAGWNSSD